VWSAGAEVKEDDMLQTFLKYVGPIQALLGVGGAAVPALAGALGTGTGGNLVNVLSGAAASYLGYKGAPAAQQRGAQILGIVNTLVGVLTAAGVNQIAGFSLNHGNVATAVSLVIGIWGLVAGFMKQK
jgi:hypothetical protein